MSRAETHTTTAPPTSSPSPVRARAEALFFAGNQHLADGRERLAEACFREAISLLPDFAEGHANLAFLLDRAGQLSEAEQHYAQAIAAQPGEAQTHLNLGALLARQKRFAEAETAYRMALDLAPDSPAAWSNLGALQASRKQEAAAELSYCTAMALDRRYHLARFNFSYLLLRQGRFDEGWRCLEARQWYAGLEQKLAYPRWRGEALTGKALLLGVEGGYGDMIQFCRYAAVLKAQGAARIGVICHPALKTLFATLTAVDVVIALDEPLPAIPWDYWTPPLSIPFHCQTRLDTIPADLPYLHAEPAGIERWAARLRAEGRAAVLYVGLAWQGNPQFENDADRSLPGLATLVALGQLAGVCFVSLQKGVAEAQADAPPSGLPLLNFSRQIVDFADTAALIANLDLVISVDSAVAHLAGALAKPCWVLLPDYQTDWRWLTGRSDSPWYPGVMRLFRQSPRGDWSEVVAEVCAALAALLRQGRAAAAPGGQPDAAENEGDTGVVVGMRDFGEEEGRE